MLKFRKAALEDLKLYFDWANDIIVREQSYNSNIINFEEHVDWFTRRINDSSCIMLIFQDEFNNNIGQVRFQIENDKNALVGISIAHEFRGKRYASEMLKLASDNYLSLNSGICINAFIKETNLSSKFAFENAGFKFKQMLDYEGFTSFHYIKE